MGWGRKGREESLLLVSGDSVGLFKGPRIKAGGETEQNGGNARETKLTRELEDRREATGWAKMRSWRKKILGVI